MKNLKAIPLSPNVMYVSWKDTRVSTSVPVVYHVYHSVHSQLKYCGNTTEKHIKCNRLKPSKEYMFYVRRNEEGFNATISNFTMEDSKCTLTCQLDYTVEPLFRGHLQDQSKCPLNRCPFNRSNKYKDKVNIFPGHNFLSPERRCPLIRGVSKDRFHCIMKRFLKPVPLH